MTVSTVNNKRTSTSPLAPTAKRAKVPVLEISDFYAPDETEKIAKSILVLGFAVVCPQGDATIDRTAVRTALDSEVRHFREFKHDATDRTPLGGFSAYGNPSSFHNPTVRELRMKAYDIIAPTLDTLAIRQGEGFKKELIPDRLLIRPAGRAPSAESWHRDEALNANYNDIVLGGWWNLDDSVSQFSCVPCSHTHVSSHSGFAPIKSKELIAGFNLLKRLVNIPPGSILLFNEKLVHEVLARKRKFVSYRLFLGWRITQDTMSLFGPDVFKRMDDQAPLTLKSGQVPPMYAKLHRTNWIEKLATYSRNFDDKCLSIDVVASGLHQGKYFTLVDRHMKSLKKYGFQLYEPYTDAEKIVLTPH